MRALRWLGASLGTLLLFVACLVLGVFLHANTPPARTLAMSQVNAVLAPTFRGRIRIERLGELGLLGISGANIAVDDPAGRPVLLARGVRVRVATWDAVRSALFGKSDPLDVDVSHVSIDALDVRLDTDDKGQLDLVNAFAVRTPSSSSQQGRGLRLRIDRIAWVHAWAHGRMAGAPPIDADVDDFLGAFTYTPDAIVGDVTKAKIVARGIANGADVLGLLSAHVKKLADPKADLEGRAAWEGIAAGIEHSLRASISGNRGDAVVDVPLAEPANIRAVWPASPIEQPCQAHLEAHGPLTDVDLTVRAQLGRGALNADGNLSLADDKRAKISFEARDIDVHQLVASAPTTRLGLTGEVSADMRPDGAVSGAAALHFLGGTIGKSAVPAASLRGSGALSATRKVNADAVLAVEEPGAPARVDLHVFPQGSSVAVDFQLAAKSGDLDRVPELAHSMRGRFRASADGELDVGARIIDARVDVSADGVSRGTTRVASASLVGRAQGALTAPRVDVALRGLGIAAGGLRFDSAFVSARGSALAPHVQASVRGPDAPDMDASADVAVSDGVSVDTLRMWLARRGERALVSARQVRVRGGTVRVDDGRIEGLGSPMTASMTMSPGTLEVLAAASAIDLGRVARLASVEKNLRGGTLSFDTDFRLQRTSAQGRVTLDVTKAALGTTQDVAGHLELSLVGRRLAGKVHAQAKDIGSLDIDAPEVQLAKGELTSAASWKQAWGTIDVDASADLAKATGLLPPDQLPVGRARGTVRVKAHVSRDDARDFTPDVRLDVTTDKLELSARTPTSTDIDGVIVYPPPAWHLEGVDLVVAARVDGDSGDLQLSTQARDAKGTLARLDVGARRFPYDAAMHDPGKLLGALRTTPFDVHLVVPERGLGAVPPILRQPYVSGRLQADVTASGTMLAPTVNVVASLRRAAYTGSARSGLPMPIDLDVAGRYDGVRGSASVKAHSGQRELLDLEAQADAALAQLLEARAGSPDAPLPWKGSARAHLTGFPLDYIAALDDKLVAGQLSGDVSLVDLNANARAKAALTVDQLSVGSVAYKSAKLQVEADGHTIDGSLRVDQTDGFLEAKGHTLATWGAAMAPSLDRQQPLDLDLAAKNFRIAALLPFVDGVLDELDGRLDSEAKLRLDPTKNRTEVTGTLALSRGTIEAGAGGGEFHDVTARMNLKPDGTLTLEKLTAKGLTGQLEVTGTAKLDGIALQSAKAVMVIPRNAAIPLTASGTDIGNVDGRIELSELTSEGGKAMDVKVDVPQLRVLLPEGSSTHAQALGSMPKVRIGAHRGSPRTFELLPLDPAPKTTGRENQGATKMTIETRLANVEVVRGTQLKVDLTGKVNVVAAGKSEVTGQIHLKRGGTLDVQGRKFTIDDGTVTLVGEDASNPEVVVRASWPAPDGTTVYAVFDGPLRTGKVTLSSEPMLSQQEIVQLVLFGAADGKQAQSPTGSTESTAIGTAGGEAAQPLNHMLGQMGLGAVTATVDTTQSANPRPEVEVQIAKDISIQIAMVLGQPPPGVNPDHTLLTLDWRFLRKWSLASTVGDAGTTIFDVLWQKRY